MSNLGIIKNTNVLKKRIGETQNENIDYSSPVKPYRARAMFGIPLDPSEPFKTIQNLSEPWVDYEKHIGYGYLMGLYRVKK